MSTNRDQCSSEVQGPASYNILDILNPDCWRVIFDQLSINEVVRTELVSRAWRRVVLDYFAGVGAYRIEYLHYYYKLPHKHAKHQKIEIEHDLFNKMIQKMGPYIRTMVTHSIDEEKIRDIAFYCHNIEALVVDDDISRPIIPRTTEEFSLVKNCHEINSFLRNLRNNFKTLALNNCDSLVVRYLQFTEERLGALARLELNNAKESFQNLDRLLDKTPNLEYLAVMWYECTASDEVPAAAVGRLSRLKKLKLWGNDSVTDAWLAAAARGCPKLREVNVGCCRAVTSRGLLALSRARPPLVELVVAGLDVTDDDLETCARCCEGLEVLDATWCDKLTPGLPARLSWSRERPLLVRLYGTPVYVTQVQYAGLTLHWEKPPLRWWRL